MCSSKNLAGKTVKEADVLLHFPLLILVSNLEHKTLTFVLKLLM